MKGSTEEGRRPNTNRVKTAGSLILASAMVFGPSIAMADDKSQIPAPRGNNSGNSAAKPFLPELGDGCGAGALRELAERIQKADGFDLILYGIDFLATGGTFTSLEILARAGYGCVNETPAYPPPKGLNR